MINVFNEMEPVRILVAVLVSLAESYNLKYQTKIKIRICVAPITKHLICAGFELIEQVCVAKLCCVEDQGRASHRVVEPGEDLDHGDVEDGDCDGKDVVDNGEDQIARQETCHCQVQPEHKLVQNRVQELCQVLPLQSVWGS